MKKGNSVRFCGGKYIGKTGWLNDEKGVTQQKVYVIVDMGDEKTKETIVNRESIAAPYTQPGTFEEAALQQHPDIESMMDKLVRQLAKCNVGSTDVSVQTIASTFFNKMVKARTKQVELGKKATWRDVTWDATDTK
jgi:hypothetical protein